LLHVAALLAAATGALADEPARRLDVPGADGWYSWTVAASETGARSCCYQWQGGQSATQRVCDLDGKRGGYTIGGDCLLDSDQVRVYVRMIDGQPERVRALNADCPVNTASEITDLGAVPADASVGWLRGQLSNERRGNSELLAAIPMHAGNAAFDALTELLEDRSRSMDTREQALFWLAQSDTDEAYDYLDRLLTSR
jgi:hypothetical protein